jgi:hypothetical protein
MVIYADVDSALGSLYHVDVASVAKVYSYTLSKSSWSTLKMETAYTCNMSPKLHTSTWCKDPRAESTSTVKHYETLKSMVTCVLT